IFYYKIKYKIIINQRKNLTLPILISASSPQQTSILAPANLHPLPHRSSSPPPPPPQDSLLSSGFASPPCSDPHP
ncbi:unnamed protein product, partial [Linum tenue]